MAREIIDAGNAVPVRQRTNVFIKKEKESTMKKKILATVLTAAMAVSMLAGCSSESASKASEAAATTAEATTAAEETKAEETTAAEAKDTGDLKTVSIQIDGSAVPLPQNIRSPAQGITVRNTELRNHRSGLKLSLNLLCPLLLPPIS